MCLHPKPWLLARSLVRPLTCCLGHGPLGEMVLLLPSPRPSGGMARWASLKWQRRNQRPPCFCTSVFEDCGLGRCGYHCWFLLVDGVSLVVSGQKMALLSTRNFAEECSCCWFCLRVHWCLPRCREGPATPNGWSQKGGLSSSCQKNAAKRCS